MSAFYSLALMFVVTLGNLFFYMMIERWMQSRKDVIVTGLVRGQRVSLKHRRMILVFSLSAAYAVGIGAQSFFTVGYVLLSRSAPNEDVGLFAQMYAYFSGIGVLSWVTQAPFWYSHLRAVLKEEELHQQP